MSVDYRFNRPDLVVTSPLEFCIEAVNAQPAGMARLEPGTLDDIATSMEDINELNRKATVRLSNAFHSKYRKLKDEYSALSHVKGEAIRVGHCGLQLTSVLCS
ncbi:hypothetical protein [Cupriavidus plantarum]|uniref:hypothetical protein n=1 Tax=Cupriavidus plantarum TaxID=942865 RepID=UPI0015CBE299|nr:hypothetical protein [Cupriavidus plantarum]NYI00646.1 hypothetical protein [Cupriavidus plantarum]